jgi:transcription elongation factor
MEEEIRGFRILGYVDDLEEACGLARKGGLSEGLVENIDSIRGDLLELVPLVETEESYFRTENILKEFIEEIIETCKKRDENLCKQITGRLQNGIYELKNLFGLEKAKALINGNGFTLISTADEEGKANTAFCGSATIIDEKHLVAAWLLLGRSIENLKKNRNCTIIGFRINEENPMATEIARVYCILEKEESQGPLFEQMKQALEKEVNKTVAEMMRKIYLFKIEEIRVSTPPPM